MVFKTESEKAVERMNLALQGPHGGHHRPREVGQPDRRRSALVQKPAPLLQPGTVTLHWGEMASGVKNLKAIEFKVRKFFP